jgi:hypothetical protein
VKRYLSTLAEALEPTPGDKPFGPLLSGTALVLGTATNFAVDDVKAFVLSLRAHFAGRVCIFVNRQNRTLQSFLHEHAIDAPLVEDLPFRFCADILLARYAYFLWYLRRNPAAQILIADSRDTLFQSDPFAEPLDDGIHYFTEANEIRLRHHVTRDWIGWAFSPEAARLLADRPCICTGTMFGRGDRIVSLLVMILSLAAIPRFAQVYSFGIDQAIVNYAAHFDLLGSARVLENFGIVATLGLVNPSAIRLIGEKVVNPDGSASPIVHQYDRHPVLWNAVVERYRLSVTPQMRAAAANNKHGKLNRKLRHWGRAVARRIPELR